MATTSNRSSGTQINQRGVTQGNTLVDPISGLPVSVITDSDGKKRLAVDANFTAQSVQAMVELDYNEDSVQLGDPNTNSTLKINSDGSIDADVEIDAGDGDNVAISDGTDTLAVNPDGSINVVVAGSNSGDLRSLYNEVTAVPNSVLTIIQTYVAPIGKLSFLQKIDFSGTNIAEYTIEVNGVVQDKKRTYFGASLNDQFQFVESGGGLPLSIGDVVTASVIHSRPMVGDFNARFQVIEV